MTYLFTYKHKKIEIYNMEKSNTKKKIFQLQEGEYSQREGDSACRVSNSRIAPSNCVYAKKSK